MQCACAIWSSVSWLAVQHFSTSSQQWHDSWRKRLLNANCVFRCALQFSCEKKILILRNERDVINKLGRLLITQYSGAYVQPLLQWKSSNYYIFRVCFCNLNFAAWNAHASYYHPWPLRLYYIFPTLSHKRKNFLNKVSENKIRVSVFFKLLSEKFFIVKIIE